MSGSNLRKDRQHGRKLEAERAASLRTVEAADAPAVFLHDAVANAQAQTSAFSDGLCRVKRVENLFRILKPRPGVEEFDDDEAALSKRADAQESAAD